MATKARQQYFADEDSLQKIRREFSIADDIQQKIDSIEPGAQVNKIETVKVNGTALVPDANKAVNVEVPEVIDNLYTVDSDNALSAKQGKLLYDYIQNIASRGRFLSNWNSATGLPMTNPSESPYLYKSGDYFVVSNVAGLGGTNYRPDGSSYTIGQASTVVETGDVSVSDFYFYDGTNWLLLSNSGRQIAVDSSLSTTSTNPVENRVITNALNNKQDTLTAGNHIDITNNVISAEGFQEELIAGDNITIGDVCIAESDTKGPSPYGFHVPLTNEWEGLNTIMTSLSLTTGDNWRINLHMPFAGRRNNLNASLDRQGSHGFYWASSPDSANDYARSITLDSSSVSARNVSNRARGFSVRCFKNEYTTPDSSWTVIQGTLGSAGIFWNQSQGLISITDGSTGYTIMDKNLGATTVYNDGDTLIEANMGNMYQWGNNYGFPSTGAITNTSSTQVDASGYGPTNPYSSSIFITNQDWSSVQNDNLWGGVSQGTHQECIHNVISATDTKYTAGTGINIDANNVISATATPGQTYTAGNGINISQNNEISADTSVVATQTDLDGKVSKGVNQINGQLFSIESTYGLSTNFGPDYIRVDFNDGTNSGSAGLQRDSLGAMANNKISSLTSDRLALIDDINLTQTTYAEDGITVADNGYGTSEDFEFTGGGNNQVARLKDVKTYTAGDGINIDANNEISNILPGPTIAATAPTGTEGALWYDTTNDVLMAHDGTAWKEAGTQMKVLSYGHSTWQDFLDAYNENAVVYCRASSNSNPGSGVQGRMAFMAFVSLNSSTGLPTEVEFQYYRSRSDHNTAANQLDQVFVYKLTSASGGTWTVTERNTGAKAVAGTGISLGWGSGNMTISADTTVLATQTDLNSKQDTLVSGTNIKTVNNESLLGSGNITISAPTYNAGPGIEINNNSISAKAGTGIEIRNGNDYSAMRGPAPSGFHIPSPSEWEAVKTAWTALGGGGSDGTNFGIALKLPFAGRRFYHNASKDDEEVTGYYWTSTAYDTDKGRYLEIDSSTINCQMVNIQSFGHSLRAFKDEPVTPTASWTKLYGTSIAAGGIFWNSTDGLISISSNGQTWITIQDKNLGATTVRNNGDYLSPSNCGYIYQWGNNYGFLWQGNIITDNVKVNTTGYGPGNYYSGSAFITVSAGSWSSVRNDDLWGGVTGVVAIDNAITNTGVLSVNGQTGNVTVEEPIEYTAGNGISIGNLSISSRQGPCEEGFHVPSAADWQGVWNIMNAMNPLLVANGGPRKNYLHMPYAGGRDGNSLYGQGSTGAYWSSSKGTEYPSFSCMLLMSSNYFHLNDEDERSGGHSIRAFKNEYVAPDNTWTVVFGTLGNSGIFWNQTEGLITITNGTTGYTMMDKNIGATVVYNDGDTLSEANCGKYFQRGNNYGFPRTGNVTTSNTAVNTVGYGPSNPYSDDTFIVSHEDWSANDNGDLWGDITNSTTIINNVISNTGVLSVNGQTGNVTIDTFQLAPNSPLTPKYRRYGSQAQYDALTQYYTDNPGDTVYFTI